MLKKRDIKNYSVSYMQFCLELHKVFDTPKYSEIVEKKEEAERVSTRNVLIGHEFLRNYVMALFSATDPETKEEIDFSEIQNLRLNDKMLLKPNYNKAILFTGEAGSGKRTVENAFVSEVFDIVNEEAEEDDDDEEEISIDSFFKYYRMDVSSENVYTKAERMGCPASFCPMEYDRKKTMKSYYDIISSGHIMIIFVEAGKFWQENIFGGHAITLLSVSKDGKRYVYNDTGYKGGRIDVVSADHIARCLLTMPAVYSRDVLI